jgi:hypothetical protein
MSDQHDQGQSPAPQQLPPPVVRSQKYQEVYSNSIRVRLTTTDCTLTFGNTVEFPGAPPNLVQDEVTLFLSIPFLKSVSLNLSAIVNAIEAEIGPIKFHRSGLPSSEAVAAAVEVFRNHPLSE